MEDRDKPKAHRSAGDAESIVELTPDLELPEDSEVRIVDLTDAVDGPSQDAATAPSALATPDKTTDAVQPVAAPTPTARETSDGIDQDMDAAFDAVFDTAQTPMDESEEPAAELEPATQPTPPSGKSVDDIEQAVDAAFDAVQAPIEEPVAEEKPVSHDDGLIDRLSDIPRRVDQAVEAAESGDPSSVTTADHASSIGGQPAAGDPDRGADDEDEGIIPLDDIVDPDEFQAFESQSAEDDDEIIELIDIVDPAELQAAEPAIDLDDDEILELTDIVDMAEIHGSASAEEMPAGVDSEQTDFGAVAEPDIAPDRPEPVGTGLHEDATDREGLEEETPDAQTPAAGPEAESAADAAQPRENESKQQEGVIRLSEVLNHGTPNEERPPIEQMKMGAEEELAKQSISLEAEDTANSMGLDLEKEAGRENKPLTDQEIEAAVERILQTKYADTIEQLIARTVEKAVSREIENIKRAMLDGDEPPI